MGKNLHPTPQRGTGGKRLSGHPERKENTTGGGEKEERDGKACLGLKRILFFSGKNTFARKAPKKREMHVSNRDEIIEGP